ncbi:MAG: fatty acid desaturase [Prolixibacteraceae bacterium]|jgi:omega-6 fatty acid desaturase (delta-12 desaturase)|nr:fatty acid desaturase [Prolixibacteraceae bacterium]
MTKIKFSVQNEGKSWMQVVQKYNKPEALRSWWQVINSVVPYVGLWVLMVYSLSISYWLTLFLSVLAAGFLVRIFIIFHDCGHGSFFKSPLVSRIVGIPLGILVFTPYHKWHHDHLIHHQTVGNLDKRGVGDVKTLTVKEYQKMSKAKQLWYRIYRHPIILLIIGPFVLFTILLRFPKTSRSKKEKLYTHLTSIAIASIVVGLSFWIGLVPYLLIQLPILYIATVHGVWLFYVQHQYEDVRWERSGQWDYKTIALEGSSYLKLPKVLQWFTGNIGFHHIHHLSPRIPNYNLEKCYKENEAFHVEKPLTFFTALKSLKLRLWDEKKQRLVSFRGV